MVYNEMNALYGILGGSQYLIYMCVGRYHDHMASLLLKLREPHDRCKKLLNETSSLVRQCIYYISIAPVLYFSRTHRM